MIELLALQSILTWLNFRLEQSECNAALLVHSDEVEVIKNSINKSNLNLLKISFKCC